MRRLMPLDAYFLPFVSATETFCQKSGSALPAVAIAVAIPAKARWMDPQRARHGDNPPVTVTQQQTVMYGEHHEKALVGSTAALQRCGEHHCFGMVGITNDNFGFGAKIFPSFVRAQGKWPGKERRTRRSGAASTDDDRGIGLVR